MRVSRPVRNAVQDAQNPDIFKRKRGNFANGTRLILFHQFMQDGFLGVQTVFRLVEYRGMGAVDHVG